MTPKFTNTATVSTRERLVLRGGRWQEFLPLRVRVGILERPEGIVLIDAGYSAESITALGRSRSLRAYAWALKPELLPEGNPTTALARLGYTPDDVTAVIITHFHVDHVSCLARFPQARLIADAATYATVMGRSHWANMHRGIFPELLPADMTERLDDTAQKPTVDAPLGLGPARDIFGDQSVLAVELPGHAEGHFGLCFNGEDRPLLYATDTQWVTSALHSRSPRFPASLVAEDRAAHMESTARVAAFADAGGTVLLCHDPDVTRYDLEYPK
ncbi:MBL fold metallo-hydrolase [Amylibacter sp. IMCC11727]|uniref:MBL fold metallo-hydrolase n=1 Tax=Amylibacter sp. IMCC11727 TaxID=3039851 RepID=UPI00244E24C7|nr:MBL fold metallo-hydrolase [Amylibacter sp. IMCC11727]WGI23275.1 MBL fold metallo-hydrolase [Amylibacter sp. IMCC11727]